MVIFQILKFQELEIFFFAIISRKWILIDVFETIVMILGYVRITGTSGFGEKNNKTFEKSEKIQQNWKLAQITL